MRTRSIRKWLAAALALGLGGAEMSAQPALPHIGYVFPAGGRLGTTFQVRLGGQFLENANSVRITGRGVTGRVVEVVKPLTQKQFNDLREKLQELQKGRKDAATLSEIAEIRKKIAAFNRNANPAIADKVTLEITVATNAEAGARELRLVNPNGLSNPLMFCLGELPEAFAAPPPAEGTPRRRRPAAGQATAVAGTETAITLPCTVNGTILAGGVERFHFSARQGQHIVAIVSARELIPYLPDAVPGWFQATLALRDMRGRELAYDDDFRFHPDPVLEYDIPSDGTYLLEIRDAIYRGREDFVYRVSIGELPFVTSIFPLGGHAGGQTRVDVRGWNLAQTNVLYDARDEKPGLRTLPTAGEVRHLNRVPFAIDALPEIPEKEPNNSSEAAQRIGLPVVVNGRIGEAGDADVFRFEGQGGERIVAEVYARRLDSPVDSTLTLLDAAGKQIAFNDDHEDRGAGLNTHHADSLLAVTLPATGPYYLQVADRQHKGGSEYGYRLRLSAPRPDFELRVVPASLSVRAGATVPLTVYVLRRDGFTNEVALALQRPPPGISLSGARIPAGADKIRLTLTAGGAGAPAPVPISIVGRATIDGEQVVRPAVPAEDMMQAFAYRHLVPAAELDLIIAGKGRGRGGPRLAEMQAVKLPADGTTARVHVDAPALALSDRVHLELSEAPDGISIERVTPGNFGADIVLHADAGKVRPGLQGNLIVQAFAERPNPNPKNKTARSRIPLGTLPAIPFEITAH